MEEYLRRYFGFEYARDLLSLPNMDKKNLFQLDLGNPIFHSKMSYNNQTFIFSIHLTIETTQSAHFESDKFAFYRKF